MWICLTWITSNTKKYGHLLSSEECKKVISIAVLCHKQGQTPQTNTNRIHLMQYQVQHCGTFFRDYYFTAVSWVRSDAVAVIWMNRAQNISLVTECSPPTWICRIVSKTRLSSQSVKREDTYQKSQTFDWTKMTNRTKWIDLEKYLQNRYVSKKGVKILKKQKK